MATSEYSYPTFKRGDLFALKECLKNSTILDPYIQTWHISNIGTIAYKVEMFPHSIIHSICILYPGADPGFGQGGGPSF